MADIQIVFVLNRSKCLIYYQQENPKFHHSHGKRSGAFFTKKQFIDAKNSSSTIEIMKNTRKNSSAGVSFVHK